MATREGLVTELTAPDGKGPGSAKVGARKVRLWWNRYQSDEASEVRDILERALASGASVRVEGKEEEQTNKAGQRYTSFTATDAVILSGNGNASAQQSTPQTVPALPVPDTRGENWRWALVLAAQNEPSDELLAKARIFFRYLQDEVPKPDLYEMEPANDQPF